MTDRLRIPVDRGSQWVSITERPARLEQSHRRFAMRVMVEEECVTLHLTEAEFAAMVDAGNALLLNPVLYGALKLLAPQIAFLDRMAICFAAVLAVLGVVTLLRPMPKPVELPVNAAMDLRVDRSTKVFGGFVVALTLLLYVIFW